MEHMNVIRMQCAIIQLEVMNVSASAAMKEVDLFAQVRLYM